MLVVLLNLNVIKWRVKHEINEIANETNIKFNCLFVNDPFINHDKLSRKYDFDEIY